MVTRIGVLGLIEGIGLGGIINMVWLSKDGNGVVGAGVTLEDRDTSGKLKLTAISSSPNSVSPDVFFNMVWITDFFCTLWVVCVLVWDVGRPNCCCVRVLVTGILGETFSRFDWSRIMAGIGVGANCFEDVWTVAWYSGTESW